MKKTPNFLIGGTAAGGTSFLSTTLIQHPQIYLPSEMRPEPLFFYKSWEYEKGLDYYLERWFSEVPQECLAIGERSSSYLFGGRKVAKKIAEVFPDIKCVFTLRNPVERTWANYRYTVLQGLEDIPFLDALSQEDQRVKNQKGIWAEIQPYNYTGRGYYGTQLSEFLEFFPREQILTIKSEDLSRNTDMELKKIYRFLNLTDLNFTPQRSPDHTSVNVIDPTLQRKLRNYFGEIFDKVIEATRNESDLKEFNTNEEDDIALNKLRDNMKGDKEGIPEEASRYLHDLFKDDLRLVEELVDFDISDWK